MTTETLTATYHVPESNLANLKDGIEKISRRCVKLGLPAIILEVGASEDRPYARDFEGNLSPITVKRAAEREAEGKPVRYIRFFAVTLTGQTPRLAGWEFLATLQHLEVDGEIANLLRVVPGHDESLPVEYRSASPENCDHCHKVIRTRKETFIVRHEETGEYKQVGRNCTQDFLGGKDPHAVIKLLEYLHRATDLCSASEDGGFGGRVVARFALETFLVVVAACIRVGGWVSRSQARNDYSGQTRATADDAFEILDPPSINDPEAAARWRAWAEKRAATDADREIVAKAVAYAQDDLEGKVEGNDYLYNLWVAVNQPMVDRKLAGITASLISHYLKEVERQTLRANEAAQGANSQFFGEVGKRADYYMSLLRVNTFEGMYGTTYIHKFVTREGNIAVWFASGNQQLEIGKEYRISATIKGHKERNGVKETAVTRCTVYSPEGRLEAEAKEARKAAREAKKAAKVKQPSNVISLADYRKAV